MLLQFDHPNVLELVGVVTVEEPILVIIPLMERGDLRSLLAKLDAYGLQTTSLSLIEST